MGEKTLKEIDNVMGGINLHPEFSTSVRGLFVKQLNSSVGVHSAAMELEAGNMGSKAQNQARIKSYHNLLAASDFLAREGITLDSLLQLGHIIEPEGHSYAYSFRPGLVKFGDFTPPSPAMLPQEVDSLVWFLGNTQMHPVHRATNAHIELVRVHPYTDGNGRAARLVQNLCLMQKGYPIADISPLEGEFYRHLMSGVLKSRYNHASSLHEPQEADKLFYEFIETKVLNSARLLRKTLEAKRCYEVSFSKVRNAKWIKEIVKNMAKHFAKRGNERGEVKISSQNDGSGVGIVYNVTGDLGYDELNTFLSKSSGSTRFRYHLTPKTF